MSAPDPRDAQGGPDGPQDDAALRAARAAARRLRRRARRALTLERAAQAFWPVWSVAAAFLGLALSGALEAVPIWAHAAALALFAAGFVAALILSIRRFRPPDEDEVRAALEAGAPGRPLTALEDAQALGAEDPGARALWAEHRRRMAARVADLRPPRPAPRLAARDPWALRLSALILLVFGAFAAALSGGARIEQALAPHLAPQGDGRPAPAIEAWALPPAYLGGAPIYLTDLTGTEAALPAGSALTVRVFDAPRTPQARQSVSPLEAGFAAVAEGVHEMRLEVARSGLVEVRLGGRTLGAWRFVAQPDAPPQVAFAAPPGVEDGRALKLPFRASDDHGLAKGWARIVLDPARAPAGAPAPGGLIAPIEIELPLPLSGDLRQAAGAAVEDLTAHPWAGLPALATLHVEDGAGQQGASAPAAFTLPARRFSDPMARALIEERRALAWSPAAARDVARRLKAVTLYPEDWFGGALRPYLAVRTAIRRLDHALALGRVEAAAPSVLELLWRAALLIEDGDMADAAERLRRARDRLSEALENGAPPDEIAALTEELRAAMEDYLAEMARQALQNLDQLEEGGEGREMAAQDLRDMLDQLEEMARAGQTDAAQRMLEQLSRMLENLRMTAREGAQGQGEPGAGAMERLGDLLGRQQELADETFGQTRSGGQGGQGGAGQAPGGARQGDAEGGAGRDGAAGQGLGQGAEQGRRGQGGAQGLGPRGESGRGDGATLGDGSRQGGGAAALARRQEALRRALEGLRGGLPGGLSPEAEEALREAERAMGRARDSLAQGAPDAALDDQARALEALREGSRRLGEALRRAAREGQGQAGAASGEGPQVDPLGRSAAPDGALDGGDTHVPDAAELKRARELLEEIRRRAGDRLRPEDELEYLRRLLDRF
ncbi:TIGR02302 family protein [Oceanicella actignis]|uniref:TIGR02302 family protein n=1 Tax=Oceanicella actignis TaxID=1189325 RepID=A0A1M7SP65_9RHOB|nr:TIGR02302 family protein [Oceanicella actignis]SES65117.1 TIGR02302 family protein [Oceanicella actignis]SHN60218.1 TIGR02302 family protein [Oceanicella actignis]